MFKRKQWAKAVRRARNQAEYNEGDVWSISELEEPMRRCENETNKEMRIKKKRHRPLHPVVSSRCCYHNGKDANKHNYDENSFSWVYGSPSTAPRLSIHSFSSSDDGRRKKRGKVMKNMIAANDLSLTTLRPYREVCRKEAKRERKYFSKRTQYGINILTAMCIKLSIAILLATLL